MVVVWCGGFITDYKTTPTKVVLSCFGLLVGLWQYNIIYIIKGRLAVSVSLQARVPLLPRPHPACTGYAGTTMLNIILDGCEMLGCICLNHLDLSVLKLN